MLGDATPLSEDVDLAQLAQRWEIAGGAIANVVRFAAIHALQQGRAAIRAADLAEGVIKELRKEGRTA
jgi:ATP-dependent 26S proteasome regulatory subunit